MISSILHVLEIQTALGTIEKQNILKTYRKDKNFCRLLYYALNPMLTYKVSEKTLRQPFELDNTVNLTMRNIFTVCEELSKRKALDDATIYQVLAFINTVKSSVIRDFYVKLLSKTLRLGVTAKTVNKIIPGLIPEWEVQQAYPVEKYPIKEGTWFTLTQKLNGVRATYYKGKPIARSGVPFEGLDHIVKAFAWDKDYNFVFDGELTLKDKGDLSDNEAFRTATGIINSDGDKTPICYTIFDVIPTDEFEKGESSKNYSERRDFLNGLSAAFNCVVGRNPVSVLPALYSGTDLSKIDELLEQMVREDKEGLMANLDTPYKRKRHNGILKIKRFYTMDLPITDCEQGSGRLSGTLGAFVLDYKGNEVRVGSGFTDEQRSEFWKNKDSLIGTLCEVKYKEISSDKNTGSESLQFPVFVSLRTDKDDVSYG